MITRTNDQGEKVIIITEDELAATITANKTVVIEQKKFGSNDSSRVYLNKDELLEILSQI